MSVIYASLRSERLLGLHAIYRKADFNSLGGRTTLEACREFGKPVLIVVRGRTRPSDMVAWIVENNVKVLNVAGDRESKSRGIGLRVELFLGRVLHRLAEAEPPRPD